MILPILAAIITASFVYQFNGWLLVLLSLLIIRICCMKNRKLLLLVLLCSFFVVVRTYFYVAALEAPQEKIVQQVMQVEADSLTIDGNFLTLKGKLSGKTYLVYYTLTSEAEKEQWQGPNIVDQVLLSGETQNFEPARNLNGFNQRHYYQSLGISQLLLADSISLRKQTGFHLKNLRQHLIIAIDSKYPPRLASYIKALVIGYKDSEFDEYDSLYREIGLLHLFTLSGLHIQFYLGSIHLVLKRLGLIRETRLVLLSISGGLLIILTGGSFSTIRAVMSFLIAFCCLTLQLELSKLDQWSIMLLGLVFCFPLALWSIGAQLSLYFALILLYLTDLKLKAWQHSLLFSLCSLPLLIYSFSEWAIVGGLFTLLLFPLFEWVILPCCVVLFIGSFIPLPSFLSQLVAFLFQLVEKVLELLLIPNLTIGKPTFLLLLVLIGLVLISFDRIKTDKKLYGLLLVASLLVVSIAHSEKGLVAFVDVGQGDSIFIKLPFKQETFLIDTGGRLTFQQAAWQRRKQKHSSDYQLLPLLKSLGCDQVDHLIITHNDADHMGELSHVLDEIKIKNLYLARGSQMELRVFLTKVKQTKIHLVTRGDIIGEQLKLHVLSPMVSQGANDDSIVTYFQVNQQKFLLTGDLETTGEQKLLEHYPRLKTDFLKVGHHGSNTSTSLAFLSALAPEYGIISAGKKNRYGHPTAETISKLREQNIKIFRTDQNGMIYYQWSGITKRGEIKQLIDFPE
ncbi:DNA internalization-related competence protein ComEC/Rec2 [Enterococcus devriesei]|uniref:DNA internalization-related competence protein ComEC/Rec2 n=1 Tax=Enterococcus devriesei TaxID=319970 RepID=UPI001FE64BC7|nr:DNA internalization-related competence protein ComEC/Rec2 [Enterococcus devriesei]MDT2820449.1 DNA internalization-related competence protein ComEC/Rec2 [Enterococcus devriesei]